MFNRFLERGASMVKTIGERYDITVHKSEGIYGNTDTKDVNVPSIEPFIDMGMTEKDAESCALYIAGHEGAHTRISDINILKKGYIKANEQGYEIDKLNHLVQITEDVRVDYNTIAIRPGYADMRNKANKALLKLGFDKPTGNKLLDTMTAISLMTYGTDLRDVHKTWKKACVDWDEVQEIADELMTVKDVEKSTSETSLNIAKRVYNKMFGAPLPKSEEDGETTKYVGMSDGEEASSETSAGTSSSGKGDSSDAPDDAPDATPDKTKDNSDDSKGEDKEDVEGNEDNVDYTEGSDGEDEVDDEIDERKIEEMLESSIESLPILSKDSKLETDFKGKARTAAYEKAEVDDRMEYMDSRAELYGTKVLSEHEDRQLFEYASSGTHAGVGLAYVKTGPISTKTSSMINYNTNKTFYDGQIKALTRRLEQDLRAAKDTEGYVSSSGSVVANRAWRTQAKSNPRMFKKFSYDEVGDYVIDILLDASGSQGSRQTSIGIQAYILAETFSNIGIPCQITMFDRDDEFTRLEQLRDYDDPKEQNIECFKYRARYDNRDGHAIRAVEWCIKRRPELNKIIIVLSDGLPMDTSAGTYPLAVKMGAMKEYEMYSIDRKWGLSAVDDVAIIVRNIRASGIKVLGVYTGSPSDDMGLRAERKMYGNDFAFIPEINDFAKIIGKYLHRTITEV